MFLVQDFLDKGLITLYLARTLPLIDALVIAHECFALDPPPYPNMQQELRSLIYHITVIRLNCHHPGDDDEELSYQLRDAEHVYRVFSPILDGLEDNSADVEDLAPLLNDVEEQEVEMPEDDDIIIDGENDSENDDGMAGSDHSDDENDIDDEMSDSDQYLDSGVDSESDEENL